MLRIVSSVVAVAAIMAIPLSQADAGSRGHSSGPSMSRMSSGGPRVGSFNTFRSSNKVSVIGNRSIIVGNRRIHHRGRFFVGVGAYGLYDTCWRWVPSVYGPRRVWVCDPYSYY
jgi:hypothetical protein